MELMQELFFTASLAIVLSFLVVKLISIATLADDAILQRRWKENISATDNEGRFTSADESDTKMEVIDSQIVHEIVGFRCQRQTPVRGNNPGEIERIAKDMTEEAVELIYQEVWAKNDFPQQFEVVELPEESSEPDTNRDIRDNDGIPLHEREEECVIINNPLGKWRCENRAVARDEIRVGSLGANKIVPESKYISNVQENHSNNRVEDERGYEGGDDDWEGIEMTELEKVFAAATKFVDGDCTRSNDQRLSSIEGNVLMEMYGLKKIATEGPCHEYQPMALKISARAKWY